MSLDELVAKDAEYRAKVVACSHDFSGRSLHGPGPVCTRCGVLELVWLRSEVARLTGVAPEPRAPGPVEISINGKKVNVDSEYMSYEDIIVMAGHKETAVVSVVFHRGKDGAEGEMCRGSAMVAVHPGMYILALVTGNA